MGVFRGVTGSNHQNKCIIVLKEKIPQKSVEPAPRTRTPNVSFLRPWYLIKHLKLNWKEFLIKYTSFVHLSESPAHNVPSDPVASEVH